MRAPRPVPLRLAAKASAPPLNDSSRSASAIANRLCGFRNQPGTSISATKRKNVRASRLAARRAWIFVARLTPAAMKQAPTKYVQNRCHGTHLGTSIAICWASVKCSVPKAASGAA
jgi:hypothetical protein